MSVTISIIGENANDALAKLHGLVEGLRLEGLRSSVLVERQNASEAAPPAAASKPVQARRKPDVHPGPEPMEAPIHDGASVPAGDAKAPEEVAPADIKSAQEVAKANEEAKQKAIQIMKNNYPDKVLRGKFKELLGEFNVSSFSEVSDGQKLLERTEAVFAQHTSGD